MQDAVRGAGVWAPALFVVLQVLVTVPPVPRTIFTWPRGCCSGRCSGWRSPSSPPRWGPSSAFWLVRLTGGGLVERFADRPPVVWTRQRLDRSGLLAMTSLRLIPVLPFSLLNYAAGAVRGAVRAVPVRHDPGHGARARSPWWCWATP